MKASYRWLRALVPGLEATPAEVAERLTRAGLEVEGIAEYGAGTKDLVVVEVRKIEPHPSRGKLRLVTVDRGGGLEQRIVCGAPNVPEPGGLVALAPLGARLPVLGTLVAREIGGIVSEGMLCSERELELVAPATKPGLPPRNEEERRMVDAALTDVLAQQTKVSHAGDPGILVLPKGTAKPGTPLREAVPAVHDFIFEIGVTPNRPDALGHIGLARELAALYELPFAPPAPGAPSKVAPGAIGDFVKVSIEDLERCPQYGAAMLVDVTIGPSLDWVRYRLESLGIRAISNVVDITNLVLLEYGHPMHAFDLDHVRGGTIVARRARAGETMKTLDGVERKLDPDDLVIADAKGPVALAGVMGGEGSEIGPSTKRVLLECAYFWPRGVRRAARRHGIHSESSHRFERGVDPGDVPDVLAHAGALVSQLAGGAAVKGTILAGDPVAPRPPIRLRGARLDALLGMHVDLGAAGAILARLGCGVSGKPESGALDVVPPTHRPDVTMEADLVEEVLRVRGIDLVPTVLPAIPPQKPRPTSIVERARRAAIDLGLSEALTFGFCSARELEAIGAPPPVVRLQNPLSEERNLMRTSLLPGLLDALRRSRRHGVRDVRLFAVGARFLERQPTARDQETGDAALPDEVPSLAIVLAGARRAELAKPVEVDVYDAKGVALELVQRITRREGRVEHQPAERRSAHLHPRAAGDVLVGDAVVGRFGPLHPDVIDALDLDGACVVVELDLRALEQVGAVVPQFRPIPVLPAATRDISLVVRDDVTAGAVADAIRDAGAELCESVELFDLFRGGSLPPDHRSLAYHVVYRDPKAATDPDRARTLTDEEVDAKHRAVVETVQKRFGAVLRA